MPSNDAQEQKYVDLPEGVTVRGVEGHEVILLPAGDKGGFIDVILKPTTTGKSFLMERPSEDRC